MAGEINVSNRFSGQKTASPGANQGNNSFAQPFIYEVAQVENIVLNEDSGADSLNSRTPDLDRADAAKTAGRVQFRILPAYQTVARKDLPWADPIIPYQSTFPIIGEYVLVFKGLGRYFYIGPLNIDRKITINNYPIVGDVVENLRKGAVNKKVAGQLAQNGAATTIAKLFKPISTADLVNYNPPDNVQPIKAYEGDIIFQGRYGNSIRLGSSQMTQPAGKKSNTKQYPNIVLRTGQSKTAKSTSNEASALTTENLQNDDSSIYLTSNQTLPFKPSTITSNTFLKSTTNRPLSFSGAQIILNTDTLVLNAKAESIFLFSKKGIHLNSLMQGITMDTEGELAVYANEDITLSSAKNVFIKNLGSATYSANEHLSIQAQKQIVLTAGGGGDNGIYLGGTGTAEPVVLANKLSMFLLEFLQVLETSQPWTVGPSGVASPALLGRLAVLWAKYAVLPTGNALFAAQGVYATSVAETPSKVVV